MANERPPLLLVGMVHLPPLPGTRGAPPLDDTERRALRDAAALAEAGFGAVMVENFGDAPFFPGPVPPHTVAAMTRLAGAVRRALPAAVKLGINVLRNDACAALAVAAAVGADLVRVNVHTGVMLTDQGLIQGQAHETVRYRDTLAPGVAIWADLRVKHAAPLAVRPLEEELDELLERGQADAVVLSGTRTGGPVDVDELARLARHRPGAPLVVGSGATPEQLPLLLPHVSAVIAGTWVKEGGRVEAPVDPARARALAEAARGERVGAS
jgi:uncharacterized protein